MIKRPYDIAREELAKWEADPDGSGNKARILEYDQCTTLKATDPKVAWCASFMNFCISGARLTGCLIDEETKSAAAISWLKWGVSTDTPKEGDIVIFKRGVLSWTAHVSFVVKVNALTVTCLGGNQQNRVMVSNFLKARVLGYRKV